MPFLKASCRILHDLRVHALGPGQAERRVRHHGDARVLQRRRVAASSCCACRVQITSRRSCPLLTSGAQPLASATSADVPAEQRIGRFRRAAERHMGPFDALLLWRSAPSSRCKRACRRRGVP